jgi:hypothetical protein
MFSFSATTTTPAEPTCGSLCYITDPHGEHRMIHVSTATQDLLHSLNDLFDENGLLERDSGMIKPGTCSALLSGLLADMPESHRELFKCLLTSHIGVTLSVPTKQEEARLEGLSIMNCPHGIPALRTLLEKTGNDNHVGRFDIISIGGGDTKLHVFDANPDGFIEHLGSMPFATKLGTKQITESGLSELDAVLMFNMPTFLMTSIGYGVSSIVRASEVSTSVSTNDDENTRNAVALATIISTRASVSDNVWVIPRRIYSGDVLPLNMLGGLSTVIKIDAGTATWKVELPNGKVAKIPVDSATICVEIACAFRWAYQRTE